MGYLNHKYLYHDKCVKDANGYGFPDGEIQSRSRVMIMMAAAGPGPWQPARRRGPTQSYIAVQDNADPGLRHCLLENASAQRLPVQCSVCQKGRIFFLRSMALSSSSLSPF